jgi:ATP-dependent helicase/nuclease subunit A
MHPAIQAGAGTGKTTQVVRLLLDRLLSTDTEPSRLIALTFTVRAANEMRDRLGSWLTRLVDGLPVRELGGGIELFAAPDLAVTRGVRALAELDRIEIGTIHSFAAHLLRQYPLEARVSPSFTEDDGSAHAALFRELWPRWFDESLRGEHGETIAVDLLDRCDVAQIRSFTAALCQEDAPLDVRRDGPSAEWLERLSAAAADVEAIHARYGPGLDDTRPRLAATLRYMSELFQEPEPSAALRRRQRLLDELWPTGRAWKQDAARYRRLRAFARRCVECDDAAMESLRTWVRPFVQSFRQEYTRRGFVSFQGLLVRAARLLREHAEIRMHLKQRFRLVLVDEFQDTDPLQGEILLFLAERLEQHEWDTHRVEVEPGKLVIVGDEKQSIYLFRGADLEAYQAVTHRLTQGDGTRVERLTVNYRSRPELIHFVNAVGRRTMMAPDYVPIEPAPHALPGGIIELALFPGVEAGAARAREAEMIAEWVHDGTRDERFRAGDVALLLRTLASAEFYTEAFRARGIDFLIEGEKHFYAAPEVQDVLNLLSAIDDPVDELAVVGVLRSPFGTVLDRDLAALRQADALTPLHPERVPAGLGHVRQLYQRLAALHARCQREPAHALLKDIAEQFTVLPLVRANPRRDQAVANVRKLLETLGRAGATLSSALAEERRRARTREEESEAVVGDEALDAVRIMSVHKAKGLEFPVVVLADLHRESPIAEQRPVLREWTRERVGFRCGTICSRQWLMIEEHQRRIQEEEERRVLYVALTRAKDRLLLTGGRANRGLLGLITSALEAEGLAVGTADRQCLRAPGFDVKVQLHEPTAVAVTSIAPPPALPEPDYAAAGTAWAERDRERQRIVSQPRLRQPSATPPDRGLDTARMASTGNGDHVTEPASLGTRCHDVLARMDFQAPELTAMEDAVRDVLAPFFRTAAFAELQRAEVCHRELPFLIELDGFPWSGQIDVVYRLAGAWIVADYKSDRVEQPARYATQALVYASAAQRALALPRLPEFRVIYLRSGRTTSIEPSTAPL